MPESGQQQPVLLFATPPPLDQLRALTVHIPDANSCSQTASKFQPQVIKCREIIFTEPEVIGTPSADIKDWNFYLIAQVSLIKSGRLQTRLARVGLQVSQPYRVTAELYQSCLRYTLTARLSPAWNKAGQWLIQGRDFLVKHGSANAVKLDLTVNQNELYFTLEATTVKLAPLQVTDLDILGRKLQDFLTRADVDIDRDSIASDWCYVLPSMKRGRIVSISYQIPEESPFVTYRDLKRHWKNTYGYRLPEDEDGIVYYQVHFGPLGGRLFTYPEMCLRAREMQRVARVDPKPILRKFIQEVQAKFPTICGQPLKLQSKAKFTLPELLESGHINEKTPANLTGKMSGVKPSLYRTQAEMDRMMNQNYQQPVRSNVSVNLSQRTCTPAERNVQSSSSSATVHNNSTQMSRPPSIQQSRNSQTTQNRTITSQQTRYPGASLPASSFSKNQNSVGQHCVGQRMADTPAQTNISDSQAAAARRLFPVFKPKKNLAPHFQASQPMKAAGPKVVPVFRTQQIKTGVVNSTAGTSKPQLVGKGVISGQPATKKATVAGTSKPQLVGKGVISGQQATKKATVAKEAAATKRDQKKQRVDKTGAKKRKLQRAED